MAWFARVGGLSQRGDGAIMSLVGRSRHLGYADAVRRLGKYSNRLHERARTYSGGLWRLRSGVRFLGGGWEGTEKAHTRARPRLVPVRGWLR